MIEGLSHITFLVKDLDRTENFLSVIFDAKKVYDSGDKIFSLSRERFLMIGGLWIVIMQGEPLSSPTYNHVAFKIMDKDFDDYLKKLRTLGVEMRESRARIEGEGRSLYFYDYDNHMFELHTSTLETRLMRYSRE